MQPLFIDTNYLCAYYNKLDSLHEKAKKLFPELSKFNIIISNFILLECYTVISQRVSKNYALIFKEDMYTQKYYRIVWIDKMLEQETWSIFASIRDKNFSYVDASILAAMKNGKITHLLSFDAGFAQFQNNFGFTLIGSQPTK